MTTGASVDIRKYLYEKVGFTPTPEQQRILHSDKRFILVAGGEQAGKSYVASKFLLGRCFQDAGNALYWLVAADYERTRAEFEYLAEDFARLGILAEVSKRIDPGKIVLADGTRIETKSAKDPRTLAMRAPNGILACEASQLDLETFYRMRGRVAPKRGWLFLSGTHEGSLGWYPQLQIAWERGLEDEISFNLPSYTNFHLYPGGKEDPEILRLQRDSSDTFFMERIEGIPSPPRGIVFPEFRPDIHVQPVEYVPDEPVSIWMDPGYAGAYAVCAMQEINGQFCMIDEIYEQGLITSEIIQIAQAKPWWKDVHSGVIDIAGLQHQAMAAPAEVWLEATGLYLSYNKVRINDGTERLKGFLKPDPITHIPKLVVAPHCQGTLSEFGAAPNPFDGQTHAYRWKTDRDGSILGETPEDKYNHAIKALIYGIVEKYGYGYLQNRDKIRVRRW